MKEFPHGERSQLPRSWCSLHLALPFLKAYHIWAVLASQSSSLKPSFSGWWSCRLLSWPSPGRSFVGLDVATFFPSGPLTACAQLPPGGPGKTCLILTVHELPQWWQRLGDAGLSFGLVATSLTSQRYYSKGETEVRVHSSSVKHPQAETVPSLQQRERYWGAGIMKATSETWQEKRSHPPTPPMRPSTPWE